MTPNRAFEMAAPISSARLVCLRGGAPLNAKVSSHEMRIFFSPNGSDPMLLDTKAGLHALHRDLRLFLASSSTSGAFPADTAGSPEPYAEFLHGLRLSKGAGEARLTLAPDRWLVLEGSISELERCARKFLIEGEDAHTHLYTAPVSLIIEAESVWTPE